MRTNVQPLPAPIDRAQAAGWLISPLFDTLLIANLFWPALVVLTYLLPQVDHPLTFVQVYLLSTPHRWVTLFPVVFDKKNFQQQPARFAAIGLSLIVLGLALAGLGNWFPHPDAPTNPLIYFMMLDYAWNAWHFASQHAGISRIYGRTLWPGDSTRMTRAEKSTIRITVLWVFIRVAVRLRPESFPATVMPWLIIMDVVMLSPMVNLLLKEWARGTGWSRLLYLHSVFGLYAAILLGIHFASDAVFSSLLIAQAVFHAMEYLAVIGWDMHRKRPEGVWRVLAPRAAFIIVMFSLVIGLSNFAVASASIYAWTLITLLVSLLHYGYDGMIWKSARKPGRTSILRSRQLSY